MKVPPGDWDERSPSDGHSTMKSPVKPMRLRSTSGITDMAAVQFYFEASDRINKWKDILFKISTKSHPVHRYFYA